MSSPDTPVTGWHGLRYVPEVLHEVLRNVTRQRSHPTMPFAPRAVLALAASMALVGCPGDSHGDADGGTTGDGGVGTPIALDFHVEGGGRLSDWELQTVSARIDVLDVHSDVGPIGDPHIVGLGTISLLPESEVVTSAALPGTYSQISIVLAASGAEASWSLTLARSSGQTIVIHSSSVLALDARCDVPSSVEHDETLSLSISFDGDSLVAAVDAASVVPASGTSTLDKTTAPALVDAIELALADAISLGCE